MDGPAVELRGISKRYPGVQALEEVSLRIPIGHLWGLAGENGSGKSTLLRILASLERPDRGTVRWPTGTPGRVTLVAQEPSLVESLTTAENLAMVRVVGSRWIAWRSMWVEAQRWAERLRVPQAMLSRPARELPPDVRQLVAIGRALAADPDMLLLDEATSALNEEQVVRVLSLVRQFCRQGKTAVFISHRLREIVNWCDGIDVLRDGRKVATLASPPFSEEDIVAAMVGRELGSYFPPKGGQHVGPPALEVRDFHCGLVHGFSVTLHQGEIVALAGLVGCGRSEILRGLMGLEPAQGSVSVHGQHLAPLTLRAALRAGMVYIPAERKFEGIVPAASVAENLLMGLRPHWRSWRWESRSQHHVVTEMIGRLGVKGSRPWSRRILELSGGNQQKVILGRSLLIRPSVYLLDEPTRGIDVGAKRELYHLFRDLTAQGAAILLSSSELPEVLGLANRIVVLFRGRVQAVLESAESSEERVMHYAVGNQ